MKEYKAQKEAGGLPGLPLRLALVFVLPLSLSDPFPIPPSPSFQILPPLVPCLSLLSRQLAAESCTLLLAGTLQHRVSEKQKQVADEVLHRRFLSFFRCLWRVRPSVDVHLSRRMPCPCQRPPNLCVGGGVQGCVARIRLI